MSVSLSDLTELAARQYGVVSTRQLRRLGLTADAIRHRCKTGLLSRVHRGVYALAGVEATAYRRLAAALLACGPGAILSHRSAAFLWSLIAVLDPMIDVTTPGRQARSRQGIRAHRTAVDGRDRRTRHRLPVTSPSLTVLDLAATDGELAGEALNEALLHRLTSEAEMRALLDRRSGHPGSGVMRRILAEGGGDFSRQAGEKALRALIRDAGLPKPRRNVGAHGHELDFFWPELRLNVEMDGYRWHSTRARLNRDRRRDAELTARGITVLRFAYDQLEEPQRVVAQLAAAIALAGIST